MFEGLSPTHLILILVIALIVFGPGKLPEIGNAIGKGIREFREATREPLHVAAPEPGPTKPPTDPSSPSQ
ncbi:MAG TPA: twin-arginine translocase TatA/TatE family subunit [Candidatus Binatus sp.]|nr:twin-arginine translocase TatA/TatE family subunit [Candidatus Binatus sp.]